MQTYNNINSEKSFITLSQPHSFLLISFHHSLFLSFYLSLFLYFPLSLFPFFPFSLFPSFPLFISLSPHLFAMRIPRLIRMAVHRAPKRRARQFLVEAISDCHLCCIRLVVFVRPRLRVDPQHLPAHSRLGPLFCLCVASEQVAAQPRLVLSAPLRNRQMPLLLWSIVLAPHFAVCLQRPHILRTPRMPQCLHELRDCHLRLCRLLHHSQCQVLPLAACGRLLLRQE